MKKKKNNKKVPSYAFGVNGSDPYMNYMNYGGALIDATGSIVSGASDETSKGSVAGSTLKGLGTGAAMGASIGSVIPGIGTAIGGAVGAVAGTIGGLVTGKKKRREAIERANRQATIEKTRNGLNQSAIAESEYWDNMTPAYTFENGGIMPDLAYVDNNEILRDDYGNIIKVPNTKPGTDNHLIDATTLDSVLSDKIKRPGTNNTFAKEGKKLVNMTKPSKGKDIFAENTNKLNKINANKAYEKLLAEQEMTKTKRGIKSKVKDIPAYENGTNDNKGDNFFDLLKWMYDYYLVEPWERHMSSNTAQNNTTADNASSSSRSTDGAKTSYYAPFNSKADGGRIMLQQNIAGMGMPFVYPAEESVDPIVAPYIETEPVIPTTPKSTRVTGVSVEVTPKTKQTATPVQDTRSTIEPLAVPAIPKLEVNRMAYPTTIDMSTIRVPRVNPVDEKPYTNYTGTIAELAPTLYNFVQGIRGPETEPLVYNPMQPAVMRTMARRRANIEPTLRANRRSRAIANYNASNTNTNTGMNMAMRTQLAADEYNANADAYARRDNANNEYLAQYASTLNDLGTQWVNARNLYQDLNARNRAAARNYTGAAATQLSNWYQNEERMRNQAARDAQVLPFLADFLRGGFTNEQVENLINRTRQGA